MDQKSAQYNLYTDIDLQLFGSDVAYFIEESVVDVKNKTMTLYSQNVTLDSLMKTEETCTYSETSEASKPATHFKQVATFSSPLGRTVQDFVANRFNANASRGKEIMEETILRVESQFSAML